VKKNNKLTRRHTKGTVMINPGIGSRSPSSPRQGGARLRTLYLQTLNLVERLHRRLQEVVKDEFERQRRDDINAIQAILLFNIGDSELSAGELRSRGYYQGSNVTYNLKKLIELGYIHHQRSDADRRTVRISLTPKGKEVAAIVARLYDRHIRAMEKAGEINAEEFGRMNQALQRLEKVWNDSMEHRI